MSHVAAAGMNSKGQLGPGYASPWVDHFLAAPALSDSVAAITATGESSIVLRSTGAMIGCGGDDPGQLCLGVFDDKVILPELGHLTGVAELRGGGDHIIARLTGGDVATAGGNLTGGLGNGTTGAGSEGAAVAQRSAVPVHVSLPRPAVMVAAGGGCCAAVLDDGSVYAWGEGKNGQIADGTTIEKTLPTRINLPAGKTVKKIVFGGQPTLPTHMLVLMHDGSVYAAGANASGQLGPCGIAVSAHANSTKLVRLDLPPVADIEAGPLLSLFLMPNGDLLACGQNHNNQLGIGALDEIVITPQRVLQGVSACATGYQNCYAIKAGRLYAWGKNNYGQLGLGGNANVATPTLVPDLSGVEAVEAGESHVLCLLSGALPPPKATLASGPGSLDAKWECPGTLVAWLVNIRKVAPKGVTPEKFTRIKLAPEAREHKYEGLIPGQAYEVVVENQTWGKANLENTPS